MYTLYCETTPGLLSATNATLLANQLWSVVLVLSNVGMTHVSCWRGSIDEPESRTWHLQLGAPVSNPGGVRSELRRGVVSCVRAIEKPFAAPTHVQSYPPNRHGRRDP